MRGSEYFCMDEASIGGVYVCICFCGYVCVCVCGKIKGLAKPVGWKVQKHFSRR